MDTPEVLPPELQKFWSRDDALSATERAEAYGIDLSLIEDNLRLTPAERLYRNDALLNETESLRSAWLKTREKSNPHHFDSGTADGIC